MLTGIKLLVINEQGVTLSVPFWCLWKKLSLSLWYFNKTLLHKSSEWSSLLSGPGLNSSTPEATNPSVIHCSQLQPFSGKKKKFTCNAGDADLILRSGRYQEGIVTHSRTLSGKIPWTGEPGGLLYMGLSKSLTQLKWLLKMHTHTHTHTHTKFRDWQ